MGHRKPGLTWSDTIPGLGRRILADYLSGAVCDPGVLGAMGQPQGGGGAEGSVSPLKKRGIARLDWKDWNFQSV